MHIMHSGDVQEQKPWYLHPWVWLLIALPATAVIAGIVSLYLAISTSDGLVVDDYYARGKAINRDLARDRAALAHRLEARLEVDGGGDRVALALTAKDYVLPRQLHLAFLHPTRQGFDQQLWLDRVSEGHYSGRMGRLRHGKWYVQLEADDWRLFGSLWIPLSAPAMLSPRSLDEH
jgi:hypothetical protein